MFDRTKAKIGTWLESSLAHLKEVKSSLIEEILIFIGDARKEYERKKAKQCKKTNEDK